MSYQLWASECSDCGVALELWSAPPERTVLPPAAELQLLWRGSPSGLLALAELLAAEGLSSRIDAFPPSGAAAAPAVAAPHAGRDEIALYVLPADAPHAETLRDGFLRGGLPEASHAAEDAEQSEGCPACGHPLAPEAAACSDCGLEFPE